MVKSGVNQVSISVDCFHQEFVPLRLVRKAVDSLLRVGMADVSWNPCWVVSKDDNNTHNRKTRAILKELKDLPVKTDEGNIVQPERRAISSLKDFLPERTRLPKGKCGDIPYTEQLDSIKTIFIEPDGRVAVCKEFYIGNAAETDIISLIERYDPFTIPEAKAIITGGMEGLLKWAKAKGVKPEPQGYHSMCSMCADVRGRAKRQERRA